LTTKNEFQNLLTQCTPTLLQEVLTGNGIHYPKNASTELLSQRIVDGIWKHSHTPIGELVFPNSLEEILAIYFKKLDIEYNKDDSFEKQLCTLRHEIIGNSSSVHIADLPEELKERLQRSVVPSVLGAGAAGGAAGTRWAALKLLEWTTSKWLDLIKLIPQIGPAIITIRGVAGVISKVSGPVGIALALWSLNNGFGPKWDKCLGLLIGSALCLETKKS
jgi:hypothetical protein